MLIVWPIIEKAPVNSLGAGGKPQVIARAGQPASPLCGWEGGGLGKGAMLLPGFWRFEQHLPCFQSVHLLPRCDWSFSSNCPGFES